MALKNAESSLSGDFPQRERIRTDLDTNFLVEAGAGSGKTRSLVERMIALLGEGRCTLDTMVAVTFTRKAAAEMRERFQIALERGARETSVPSRQLRLKAALDRFEQCRIGTIHSFCARLLKERPVEAGLDPDFLEMDDVEDSLFRMKCWRDFLDESRVRQPELMDRISETGVAPEDLGEAFAEMDRFPDVRLMPGKPEPPDLEFARDRLTEFLSGIEKKLPGKRPAKGWDGLQTTLMRCLDRNRNLGLDTAGALISLLEMLESGPAVIQNRWPSRERALEVKDIVERFRRDTVLPSLKLWREFRHALLLEWLEPAREFARRRRMEAGLMNYEDLLTRCAGLLRDFPEVRASFRERISSILVDEFQDTDPIQAEILFLISGGPDRETDWRRLRPRPGSLFLVGDPKQSIYRFRRADVDTYNLVKGLIVRAGGDVLELSTNFRSLPELGEWGNPVFRGLFPMKGDRYQAAFVKMEAFRERRENPPHSKPDINPAGVFRLSLPRVNRNLEKEIAKADAEVIAAWIAGACRRGLRLERTREEEARLRAVCGESDPCRLRPGDVLILFRYKKNMDIYARALEVWGIPFEISGSRAEPAEGENLEVLNLVRALRNPTDPIPTVAVLRGLFFGISDTDLYHYHKAGGDFSFLPGSARPDAAGKTRVSEALDRLREWWEWTRRQPAVTALERILDSSGFVVYLAGEEMGSSRAGNCLRLLESLREKESENGMSFAEAAAYLEEQITLHEMEEASLFPGRSDAVRLMNLHKAKGLEAPVVFLANPAGLKPREPERHIRRWSSNAAKDGMETGGGDGFFRFSVSRGFQRRSLSQPVGWEDAASEERRYLAAEADRLSYVAATRARNLLVVSRYPWLKPERRAWGILDDFLEDVPELARPAGIRPQKKKLLDYDPEDLSLMRRTLKERVSRAVEPGFLRETVTSLAKSEAEKPFQDNMGRGLAWGRMVHGALEALGRAPTADPEPLVINAMTMEGWDPGDADRLLRLLDRVRLSELWKRAMRSERRLTEVPFSVLSDESQLARGGEKTGRRPPRPVVLHGVIDLVFREAGEWVIADYKTDSFLRPEKYVEYYAPQIRLYARFWRELTGDRIKEKGLFFTDYAKPIWIPVVDGDEGPNGSHAPPSESGPPR